MLRRLPWRGVARNSQLRELCVVRDVLPAHRRHSTDSTGLHAVDDKVVVDGCDAVLFNDNHVIVVHKRAGVLSQSDSTGDGDALSAVRRAIGRPFVHLIHRCVAP
jgi:23S rRNA-/tRNA-specific pseudouridylate synthase